MYDRFKDDGVNERRYFLHIQMLLIEDKYLHENMVIKLYDSINQV